MRKIDEFFVWEIGNGIKETTRYKQLVTDYFRNTAYSEIELKVYETKESRKFREQINLANYKILKYITAVEEPTLLYRAPPTAGGFVVKLNLIDDMFNLDQYQMDGSEVIDMLNRVLGAYNAQYKASILRTLNPFIWIGKILELIASIPFMLLGSIGFDKDKIENTPLVRVFKYLIKFIITLLILLKGMLEVINLLAVWQ